MQKKNLKRSSLAILASILCLGTAAWSQPVVSSSPPVPALMHGALAWGDYNGDNLQDLILCGEDSLGVRRTHLMRNTGTNMVPDLTQSLAQVSLGDVAWGDVDGDSDLDLVLTGEVSTRNPVTNIYENVAGNLQLVATGLPGLAMGRTVLADLDGDSDLDIFLTGYNMMEGFVGMIARNNGTGAFGSVLDSVFSTREWTSVGIGDYDQDGLPDIAFADISPDITDGMRAVILHNDGGMNFSEAVHFIPGFYSGSLDFSDADGDGDLDLLCAGMGERPVTGLFKYEAGQFQPFWQAPTALGLGEARWADFNNDGDPDFVSCGRTSSTVQAIAYKQVSGAFVQIQGPAGMPRLYHARLAWGDWNGDNHPDFAIIGQGADDLPASYIATWNPSLETFDF
jgi:hypothetical protein